MLGVVTHTIGLRSETFIRRHVTDLDPENTVVAYFEHLPAADKCWSVDCPTFQIRSDRVSARFIPPRQHETLPARILYKDDYDGLFSFLRDHGVQVILGEYLNCTWPLLKPARRHGIKLFAHAHGHDLSTLFRLRKWRRNYADYKQADGLIVVNQVMRERLLSIGIPDRKIITIPYGVDVSEQHPEKVPGEIFRWLAVGRMVEKKAPLKTLQSFRIALLKNQRMHLDMIGDGPLLAQAKAFVMENSMSGSVSFHGGQSSDFVRSMMRQANGFVQHSVVDSISGDEEGMPVAIREAMGAGLPVVSTRHTGIPEAVIHGETGLLVEEGDMEGMASCMVQISASESLWREMSLAAWERAKANFTWEREREDLLRVLYAE